MKLHECYPYSSKDNGIFSDANVSQANGISTGAHTAMLTQVRALGLINVQFHWTSIKLYDYNLDLYMVQFQEISALTASSPDLKRTGSMLKRPLKDSQQTPGGGAQPTTPQSGLTGRAFTGDASTTPSDSYPFGYSSRLKGAKDTPTRRLQMSDPTGLLDTTEPDSIKEPASDLKPTNLSLRPPKHSTILGSDMLSDKGKVRAGPSQGPPSSSSQADYRQQSAQQMIPGSSAPALLQRRHDSGALPSGRPPGVPAGDAVAGAGLAAPNPPVMMFGRSCPVPVYPRGIAEPSPAQTVAEVGANYRIHSSKIASDCRSLYMSISII